MMMMMKLLTSTGWGAVTLPTAESLLEVMVGVDAAGLPPPPPLLLLLLPTPRAGEPPPPPTPPVRVVRLPSRARAT